MAFPSRQSPALPRRFRCSPRVERLEERNLMTFFGGYRTVAELLADAATVTQNYPAITELVDYGDSYSKSVGGVTTPRGEFVAGYDLLAVRVTNRAIPGPKPVFFLLTGLHSREISTPEVGMRYLNFLTQQYGENADVTWIVDNHEIWIVPSSNPDGHWYVEQGTRPPYNSDPWLWRKNGRRNACTTYPSAGQGNSYGVDLNRNFADFWGGVGSSNSPCNQTYRGTSVASEPEVAALQNLVRTLIPDQRGTGINDPAPDNTTGIFIDLHTYGGYVLWPWGHTSAAPPNSTGLRNIGNRLAATNGYTAGQSNQTLYATTGTSNGWAYGELGVPAFTIEMDAPTFLAPYSTVDNQLWPEMFDPFLYSAKIARAPYQLARGPDTTLAFPFLDGTDLYVIGGHDERLNGGQAIGAAEFYVDTPPWAPGAVAYELASLDGAYDNTVEYTFGVASLAGLPPGRHMLYVRGRDAAGNWGPVSAEFVDLGGGFQAPGRGAGVVEGLLAGASAMNAGPLFAPAPEPFRRAEFTPSLIEPGRPNAVADAAPVPVPLAPTDTAALAIVEFADLELVYPT